MPYINMKTSEKLDTGVIESLKTEFGKAISLIPGKSERWLMINFDTECKMAFSGDSKTAAAMLEVEIFGNASDNDYDKLTAKLCDIVEGYTGVKKDRIYIKYREVDRWGYNGFNF